VDKQDVSNATEAVRGLFPATPLQLNEHLSARYGADIWLKREDLTPVRSYKIRGAFNFFRKAIAAGGTGKTFVCASAGNHAQGFAFVCRHFGVPGVVFMPVTTPQQKIDKTRMFGGEFITIKLFGDFFDQCYQAAREHVQHIDGVMVPPFDHADIIEGQATRPSSEVRSGFGLAECDPGRHRTSAHGLDGLLRARIGLGVVLRREDEVAGVDDGGVAGVGALDVPEEQRGDHRRRAAGVAALREAGELRRTRKPPAAAQHGACDAVARGPLQVEHGALQRRQRGARSLLAAAA